MAPDERDVAALERTGGDELTKALVRLLGARDDEQARRVAVEPVHDARALLVTARGAAREPLNESPVRVTRAGMDDDAGRLVHDEQVLVLVGDGELDVLGLDHARGLRGHFDLDLLPTLEPVALRPRPPVDAHVSLLHEPLCGRSRAHLGQLGEEPVEPRSRGLLGDANPGRREPAADASGSAAEGAAPRAGRARRGR